ncbi:hypothetical protein M378DRAFT_70980 [Amanita muscaria Koide BX008]|uniref:HAD hydrolase n=1 Tax=Amanita muscaria (strain Koide BX008) TaxID=946122 RepID=A0A0C2X3V3_AMAMK|nr:hypothetical protein M378DRAFT_70980 [Amanita muscaria Koide BX008]
MRTLSSLRVPRALLFRSYSHSIDRPPLAFVFDIDGVLLRGENVLPAAKRALAILNGDNPYRLKLPYLFLTNGGGVGETERCQKLSKQLEFPVSPDQYIQAHTILKKRSSQYADKPVLALGGKLDVVRRVAESYGFHKVYNTLDILRWNPSVWPFHHLSPDEHKSTKVADFSQIRFSAVFVFHDPRNWGLDVQVTCDILLSGGIVGAPRLAPGSPLYRSVELVFCNPDLLWRSDFEQPRLGQGAFKVALLNVHKDLTGSAYPYVQYGKPTKATYDFAEQVLRALLDKDYGFGHSMPRIYMIGDNPASDITGANAAGWASILVKTGVYDPKQGRPSSQPTHEAEDVEEAVQWAIKRELAGR